MTMTDPLSDMFSRIRNANQVLHKKVTVPSSRLKVSIADLLKREGYILDYSVIDEHPGQLLVIELKYGPDKSRALVGLKRSRSLGCVFTQNHLTCRKYSAGWGLLSSLLHRAY